MAVSLKPLREQVIVITGASSGIGLVTARRAARKGAKLVLAARGEEVLRELAEELEAEHATDVAYVKADVAREADVHRIAEAAIERWGGFDTWVNNAAVSIYGRLYEITIEEHRQLFEINYWGYVYGSRIALEHLRERGGALINVGSVLSDRSIPDQGPYCASKHAIKGMTDCLRMEIEEEGWPISITLIKPSAIDTPYKQHAKNYLPKKAKNPPPVYLPNTVARAILHAAAHPKREITVGGAGRMISLIGMNFPRLTDLVMEQTMTKLQMMDEPAEESDREGHSLYESTAHGSERGVYPHYVLKSSLYTQATMHPVMTGAILLGLATAAGSVWRGLRSGNGRHRR